MRLHCFVKKFPNKPQNNGCTNSISSRNTYKIIMTHCTIKQP